VPSREGITTSIYLLTYLASWLFGGYWRCQDDGMAKIGKMWLIEKDSYWVQRKMSGELWSTNYTVGHVSLDPPKSTFSGSCSSAPQILRALDIHQGLLEHNTNGVRSPPKDFKGGHLKFGLTFSMFMPITLWLVAVTSRNFTRSHAWRPAWYYGYNFLRATPNKIWECRNVQNLMRFLTTFTSISGMDQQDKTLKRAKVRYQLQPLPSWAKKLVNCGTLIKKL